jgi:adenosylhomocysteine nucleosidase
LRDVGIVCALPREARHLGSAISANGSVAVLGNGIRLRVSGMGATAAAAAARELLGAGAAALVSFGLAGALDPSVAPGAIFLPGEVTGAEGDVLATEGPWRRELGVALGSQKLRSGGRLFSSTAPVTRAAAKAELFRATHALAVDMESFWIAAAAAAAAVPFIAVRVIVDGAADEIPAIVSGATDAYGRLQAARLIGGLLQRPQDLLGLSRLTCRYAIASRGLALAGRRLATGLQ